MARSISMAMPKKQKIVPAFIVEKLEGKIKRILHGWDAKGVKNTKEVEEPAGYMVSFPAKGHSIRVSESELKRMEFDQTIPLIDGDGDDEAVGYMPNPVKV